MTQRLPIYAISHGGGPWPWIKELMKPIDWNPLERALKEIPAELPETPRAILVVSGHWETPVFTVQTSLKPPMFYDYWGFPPETYEIQYPAPGDLEVANRVNELLTEAGIPNAQDPDRGFDHGTFVPMHVMFPEANVPVVQISILDSFDPAAHLAAGRALAPLRDEGILIIGSGQPTYHDLSQRGAASQAPSRIFDEWLTETVVETSGAQRSERLTAWDKAPAARQAHPREDHLIPLIVAVAAAESEQGVRNYHENTLAGYMTSSAYRVGELPT